MIHKYIKAFDISDFSAIIFGNKLILGFLEKLITELEISILLILPKKR